MRLRRTPDPMRPGDEVSLRDVYDEHAGELFAFAHRSLGEVGPAEEAVRETFLTAWRNATRFRDGFGAGAGAETGFSRNWLLALCRNAVIDRVRPGAADGATMEQLLVGLQAEEALRRVSPDHRRVLIEVHVLGRPPADVADELLIPVGTVCSRVYYALKAVSLVREEMGWEA